MQNMSIGISKTAASALFVYALQIYISILIVWICKYLYEVKKERNNENEELFY